MMLEVLFCGYLIGNMRCRKMETGFRNLAEQRGYAFGQKVLDTLPEMSANAYEDRSETFSQR